MADGEIWGAAAATAECARRSGAPLGSGSRKHSSGRVPGLGVRPARLLRAGHNGALGSVRNPQGRTTDCDPGAGAMRAQERQWRTRTPSRGHRPRGAAGAWKARLQRPAHRLLPRRGAAPSRDATSLPAHYPSSSLGEPQALPEGIPSAGGGPRSQRRPAPPPPPRPASVPLRRSSPDFAAPAGPLPGCGLRAAAGSVRGAAGAALRPGCIAALRVPRGATHRVRPAAGRPEAAPSSGMGPGGAPRWGSRLRR